MKKSVMLFVASIFMAATFFTSCNNSGINPIEPSGAYYSYGFWSTIGFADYDGTTFTPASSTEKEALGYNNVVLITWLLDPAAVSYNVFGSADSKKPSYTDKSYMIAEGILGNVFYYKFDSRFDSNYFWIQGVNEQGQKSVLGSALAVTPCKDPSEISYNLKAYNFKEGLSINFKEDSSTIEYGAPGYEFVYRVFRQSGSSYKSSYKLVGDIYKGDYSTVGALDALKSEDNPDGIEELYANTYIVARYRENSYEGYSKKFVFNYDSSKLDD